MAHVERALILFLIVKINISRHKSLMNLCDLLRDGLIYRLGR